MNGKMCNEKFEKGINKNVCSVKYNLLIASRFPLHNLRFLFFLFFLIFFFVHSFFYFLLFLF